MPRRIIILLFSTAFLLTSHLAREVDAQTGLLNGVVRDMEGQPIPGAEVVGGNSDFQRQVQTTSNDSGRFSLVGLQRGQWLFIVKKIGFNTVEGFADIMGTGNDPTMSVVMEIDPLRPPAPSTGVLAGLRADELQDAIDAANVLFDAGNYDEAIEAYEAVLGDAPQLTSLNLQIGHAYREKLDTEKALAAYRSVPDNEPAGLEALEAIHALQNNLGDR